LGLSTTEIGLLYLDYAGITALSNIYFGRVANRGRRKLLIFAGCLAGLVAFFFLPKAYSLNQVLVLMALIGLGMGVGNPAAAALIADTTCATRRGESFGIFNTARMSGVVVGPLIAGLVADLYGANGAIYAFTGISSAITVGITVVREPRAGPICTVDGYRSIGIGIVNGFWISQLCFSKIQRFNFDWPLNKIAPMLLILWTHN
jgi:MFS family permease